jgi:beta-N-acetylhexosaminidase
MSELERLAAGCLLPGFEGFEPPDWMRGRLADGLGGVVLYAWNVESREQLTALTTELRGERHDVLIAIDEEGGDVTRLEAASGSSFPGNAALGAVDDVGLTEQVAHALGGELAAVGVNLDFAPVADVNSNPANPIIGVRSFGSEPELVARHVGAFVRGLQSAGLAACAKHFPGHGDAAADSHLELPTIDVDVATLSERELRPFRAAIEADVRSIMTAHIRVPALGDAPATTSRVFLHDILREELGFQGMVVTDALEMRAISATIGVEEGAVRSLAAGADALCLGHDLGDDAVGSIMAAIVTAVRSGRLAEERLADAFERVRTVSEWATDSAVTVLAHADVGRLAAARALVADGDVGLSRPALIVELVEEPSIAVGASTGPGEWLRRSLPGSRLLHVEPGAGLETVRERGEEQLVVVTRDAHRNHWQQAAAEQLIAEVRDGIVVEVGLPHWRPPAGTRFVGTYGAARVNLEAAAKRLSEGAILAARRGVEQSGSSPGS